MHFVEKTGGREHVAIMEPADVLVFSRAIKALPIIELAYRPHAFHRLSDRANMMVEEVERGYTPGWPFPDTPESIPFLRLVALHMHAYELIACEDPSLVLTHGRVAKDLHDGFLEHAVKLEDAFVAPFLEQLKVYDESQTN
jgi:hypothetical protein